MFWVCYCFPIWWSERTICSSICTFNAKKIENLFFYIQKSLQWDVYCGVVCVGGEALFTEVFPLWWWWCFQQQQRRMRFTAQNRHKDWQRRHVDMIRLFYLWYGSLCRYRSSSGCSEVIMCVCVCACMHVCVGQQANDRAKKQTGWLRCPQLQPIGSPKMHHSCPPANPGLPCGAGISLEDCYLAKCSQANDGAGSRGWKWNVVPESREFYVEPFSISGRQTFFRRIIES